MQCLRTVEKTSAQRRLRWIDDDDEKKQAEHQKALERGLIANARGKDIYKALWQNAPEYHDWRREGQLFGGETETFEFKTFANERLEELGYDGLTHLDLYNPGNKGKPHLVTIAFHANQVRSAHANFDPDKASSPKMHEQRKGR